ncbi:hypothetical protein ACFO3U_10910 [Flavobacterium ponti]|uniref:Uncharacterized protein n=1 Tax=Flavobacterium ponti TaxID=665133 RepID=A0ABV9P4F8_9FLAO
MITPEQLKYCQICNHRKLDFDKGIQCKLTDASPTFEKNCPTFDLDENAKIKNDSKQSYSSSNNSQESGLGWKVALSFIIAVIAVIRLAVTCNRVSENNSSNSNYKREMENMIQKLQENAKYQDQMPALDFETRQELGINQMTSDSLIQITNTRKLLLPKGYYIFENLTNSDIVFLGRDTQNSNIAIYKIKKEPNIRPSQLWKKMRSGIANTTIDTELFTKNLNNDDFEYTLKNGITATNGYAWVFEEDGYWFICQLENSHDSKDQTHLKSMNFFRYQIKKNR